MTQSAQPSVIVIGAGVAGLAAARHLAQAGVRVTVLEKDARVGGRVYTDIAAGFAIDTGAQFITNFYPNTLRLIHELRLGAALVPIPGGIGVLRNGRLHTLRPDARLLFTHLVSPSSKYILRKTLSSVVRHRKSLDLHGFHKAHRLDTRSITEYARQELNDDVLEYVFQPAVSGVCYWTPEHTSQAMLFMLLRAVPGMKLCTLRGGLGQLPEAMAADLAVHVNTEVRSVTRNASGAYTIQTHNHGEERTFVADGVVCAVPATLVPALFPELHAQQRAFFEAIDYSATTITAIGMKRRLPSDLYGLFFPRREAEYLTVANIESARHRDHIPHGHDVIMLYPSGPASQSLLGQDDATIHALLRAELRRVCPAYDPGGDEIFYRVFRWPQALPLFDVGHFKRLKAFADGAIEPDRVVFAGDYLGGPFIEGAITSGLQAAARLLNCLHS